MTTPSTTIPTSRTNSLMLKVLIIIIVAACLVFFVAPSLLSRHNNGVYNNKLDATTATATVTALQLINRRHEDTIKKLELEKQDLIRQLQKQQHKQDNKQDNLSQLEAQQQQPKAQSTSDINNSNNNINNNATTSSSNSNGVYLTIVIPTVSRTSNVDYLTRTLYSIYSNSYFGTTGSSNMLRIILVNHNGQFESPHLVFESLKDKILQSTSTSTSSTAYSPQEQQNLSSLFLEFLRKTVEFISSKQQARIGASKPLFQQTTDFTWTIQHVLEKIQQQQLKTEYLLFMEDDWSLCTHGMLSIQYLISKATALFPQWIALRNSYGLNGVIIKSGDLSDMVSYYQGVLETARNNIASKDCKPPDHIVYDWFMKHQQATTKPVRKLIVFRYNVFFHIGAVSTFAGRQARYTPQCYQYMYDWLLPNEIFNNEQCPKSDIWPCTPEALSDTSSTEALEEQVMQQTLSSQVDKWKFLVDFDVEKSSALCRMHFPYCKDHIKTDKEASENACRIYGKA